MKVQKRSVVYIVSAMCLGIDGSSTDVAGAIDDEVEGLRLEGYSGAALGYWSVWVRWLVKDAKYIRLGHFMEENEY